MNENGGEITVTLKMDDKQFVATAAAADATGKDLGKSLENNQAAAADRVSNRFKSYGSIVSAALLTTTVAAGVAGVAAIKMSGDFEQSMNILQSVSGATGEQFAVLSAKARELGKDASLPGISAADAAGAMSELAKAGLSVNDVLTASKGVLSLAKAGQLDVSDAATIAARALNTFGLSGDKATLVADLLAAGANSSTASVQDMAEALSQGGAGAKQFGISVNDTVTALALFSNAGINGSDAGTSLKTMLQRLAAPTTQSADAMKALGLDFFDAAGNFVGLENTAGQLQKALGKLTTEQKNNALATIFGSDSSRVAAILADKGATGFDKMALAVNKSGAATDLAAAQNKGFNGALDNLQSTLETIGTDIGTKVLPPLTEFVKQLADNAQPAVDWIIKNGKVLTDVMIGLAATFVAIKVANFANDISLAGGLMKSLGKTSTLTGLKLIANAIKSGVVWVAQGVAAAAAWVANFAVMIAKAIATGVVNSVQAMASGAVWVAQAIASGAAWVAQFIVMQAKAVWAGIKMQSPALATGLVWIAQAVASAAAWAVQFAVMVAAGSVAGIKMAASGIVAAASWIAQPFIAAAAWTTARISMIADMVAAGAGGVINALEASAAWVASAVASAAAWALNMVKMIPYFVGIAIGATANAAIASASWIASAAASAVAWVVTELPKIIAAFIVTSGAAIAQAAIATAAWVTSAVTSSVAFTAFAALVSIPIVMGAIVVAAALASIALVYNAVQSVMGAVEAMNGLATAQANNKTTKEALRNASAQGLAAGRITKAQYEQNMKLVNAPVADVSWFDKLLTGKWANGTNFAPGGLSLVGENGPELLNIPRGSQVIPNGTTNEMLSSMFSNKNSGSKTITINQKNTVNNNVDSNKLIGDMTWALNRV